jgi:hypothetical protein
LLVYYSRTLNKLKNLNYLGGMYLFNHIFNYIN